MTILHVPVTASNPVEQTRRAATAINQLIVEIRKYLPLEGGTLTGDLTVPDEAYGIGWDGSLEVPTKNALYDKIETISAGGGVSDGDKGDIVVSGSGTVWSFDTGVVTAFAKTFLDDANAAAVQSTLGLVIGTNVQAYDADLGALAANATNGLWARTGAGTGAARTITAGTGITVSNGDGNAGNPTISSNGWVELLNFDFASGAASTKEVDVTGYKQIQVIGYQLVHAAAVQRSIQFSVDGGSTWFTTSGDYQDTSAAGAGANNAAIFTHTTGTTAARDFAIEIKDNDGRIPVVVDVITRGVQQVFKASATAINRIRLMGSVAASGTPSGSNFTAGTLRVRARI